VATLAVDGDSPEVTEIGQTDCGTTACVFFKRLTVVRRDQPFPPVQTPLRANDGATPEAGCAVVDASSRPRLAVRAFDVLRLGGVLLAEEDGQDHHRQDGEKLALPVLEGLEPELRGDEILRR
jgi:hypothetical protein